MDSAVFRLCDEYVRASAALDPVYATLRGIVDAPRGAGTDYGPDGHAARADLARETLRTLSALTPASTEDRAAAGHLRERLQAHLAWYDSGEQFRQLRGPFGLIQIIRDSVDLLPRDGEDDWAAITQRLAAVPGMLASWRASLASGRAQGLLGSRRQAVEAALQAERYAGLPNTPPAHGALVGSYAGTTSRRAELATAADAAHAAYRETARFLRQDYAPNAVEADAVGPERYAIAARLALGADVDLAEAYAWGWEELHRIEDEIAAEVARIRPGATIDEVTGLLGEREYVDGLPAYRRWLQDRHDEAIERLAGRHFDIPEPLRSVDVTLAIGSSAGAPYYSPPSEDLRRPGRTWWPVGASDGQERFEVWRDLTTVFHEGVPGHHLQLGTLRVLGDRLSRFARVSSISAHSEGWALYAERLADELGWFEAPGTRLGMLAGSAIRAARVVIDIGLHLGLPLPPAEAARHGQRWSFEVACEVLCDRGGLAAHRVHPEVVRYCGWPGQAPSYKLGERAWLAARDQARERAVTAGGTFDPKRWHAAALALGPVGLDGLADLADAPGQAA